LQEFNIEYYVEAAHFEWAMLDNSVNAKQLINKGIEKAKQKIEELENLLLEINTN